MSELRFPRWFNKWGRQEFEEYKASRDRFFRRYDIVSHFRDLDSLTCQQAGEIETAIEIGRHAVQNWTYARITIDNYAKLVESVGSESTEARIVYALIEESFGPTHANLKKKVDELRRMRSDPNVIRASWKKEAGRKSENGQQ